MGGSTGQLAFGIAGAAIGGFFGGPAGASIGFTLGSAAGGLAFPEDAQQLPGATGPRINDLTIQTSTYGKPIPKIYGTVRIGGNVIWATDIQEVEHTDTVRQGGGKGGGGGGTKQKVKSYTYQVSMAVSLCENEIVGIKRVWAGKIIVRDPDNPSLDDDLQFTLYTGTETQTPDPTIEAQEGVGNVPAFRGQAYVVFTNLQLARFGNSMPNFTFEVVTAGSLVSLSSSVGVDAGPSALVHDPETGLLWVGTQTDDTVQVIRPDTMAIVKEFPDMGTIRHGAWVPGFTLVSVSLLGAVSIQEIPPRMWFPNSAPAGGSGDVKIIDTRSYKVSTEEYNGGSFVYWPTVPLFDFRNVDLDGPNLSDPPIFIAGGAGINKQIYSGTAGAKSQDPGAPFILTSPTLSEVMDAIAHEEGAWWAGFTGYIHSMDSDGSQRWATQPLAFNGEKRLAYDPVNNYLYVAALDGVAGTLYQLNASDGSTIRSVTYNPDDLAGVGYHPGTGDLWVIIHGAPVTMKRLDSSDLSTIETITTDISNLDTGLRKVFMHPVSQYAFFMTTAGTPSLYRVPLFNSASATDPALSDVVTDICLQAGYVSGDLDVTALVGDTVKGYAITNRGTARQALEPLASAYFFEVVESDYKLKFVKRGLSSVATIDINETAARKDGAGIPDRRTITRLMEVELPNHLDVVYVDWDNDHQLGTQYARRLIGASEEQQTMQLPVTLTADKARRVADVLLYNQWNERNRYSIPVPRKHARLDPGDVFTLVDGLDSRTLRIIKTDFTLPSILVLEAVPEDSSIYTSLSTGVQPIVTAPARPVTVATTLQFLDIPILRDQDDDAGLYIGASGVLSGWTGCEVWKSRDGGEIYNLLEVLTNETTIGVTESALATTLRPHTWDRVNTVDIELIAGSLSSSSEANVLNFANAALIGSEIIQFVNVTSLGGNEYRLDTLLRGRKGTDDQVATHTTGEFFVLLTEAALKRISMVVDEIGMGFVYKGVTFGRELQSTLQRYFQNSALGLKPYMVNHVDSSRSMDDITITWIRSSRVGHEWRDLVDNPLGELTEKYEIDILNGSTVVRTLTATSETVTYTSAQQTTDFGSPQSAVTVRIYQMSTYIGRGKQLEAVV